MLQRERGTMAHLRINNEYTRCPEFMEFACTPAYGVWTFLAGQVVRKYGGAPGARRIWHVFYMGNKMLCASYSVENIARHCRKFHKNGKPNKSWVSRYTRKLVKIGIIKKHKDGRKVIYQLGYVNKEGREILFIDEYFAPKAERDKERRAEARIDQRESTMTEHTIEQLHYLQQ